MAEFQRALPPGGPDGGLSVAEAWRAVRRNMGVWGALIVAGGLLGGLLSLLIPPTYESSASVRIREQGGAGGLLDDLGGMSGLGSLVGLGDEEVSTEIAVLRSRRIVGAVADSLALHVEVSEPVGGRSEVLAAVSADVTAVPARYRLERTAGGSYALAVLEAERPDGETTRDAAEIGGLVEAPASVVPGVAAAFGGVRLTLRPELTRAGPDRIDVEVHSFLETVEELREDLRVSRADGSRLVEVAYRDRDPVLSAGVVNGVATTFVDYRLSTAHSDARVTVDVLRDQVIDYESRLAAAEQRLRLFQEREDVVAPDVQASAQVDRVAAIQVARDEMTVERRALARLLEAVRARHDVTAETDVYRQLATFPSFISNDAVQGVLQSLLALEDSLARQLTRHSPEHAEVQAVAGRIRALDNQLYELGQNYLESLDTSIRSASESLDDFAIETRALPAKAIEFARLTREIDMLGEVYVLLQRRLKEAEILDLVESGGVRLVDRGVVPEEPEFPKPSVNVLLGLVLGTLVGFVVVIGRESTDGTVRSPADAREAGAGVPLLASIPPLPRTGAMAPAWRRALPGAGRAGAADGGHPPLTVRSEPETQAAEAYRSLRTSVMASNGRGGPHVMVITSAAPGEGKTTTAANLAWALAQQGTATLLIDGDLRRGVLHRMVDREPSPGLAEVLAGDVELATAILEIPSGGATPLHFLPRGEARSNAADLLASARARSVLAEARERYAAVIVDSPALGAVTDAGLIGRHADATLVVAREGHTPTVALQEAVALLRELGAPVGGVVLNEVRSQETARYPRFYDHVPGSAG